MAIDTPATNLTQDEIVALSKRHSLYEWSAQNAVDPIPVARAAASRDEPSSNSAIARSRRTASASDIRVARNRSSAALSSSHVSATATIIDDPSPVSTDGSNHISSNLGIPEP